MQKFSYSAQTNARLFKQANYVHIFPFYSIKEETLLNVSFQLQQSLITS